MRLLLMALVALLIALQYRLWFGEGSVQEVWRLREEAQATRTELARLQQRNRALAAEVADLKSGLDAIEERARSDLGMIDEEETFYQFVGEEREMREKPRVTERPDAAAAAAAADADGADAERSSRPPPLIGGSAAGDARDG